MNSAGAEMGVLRLWQLGSLARVIMGIVFIVAGAAKSWDPVIFYWEVVSYLDMLLVDRHAWHQLASTAIVLAPVEVGVGVGLLLNWRPRWIHPLAVAMMTGFLALTVYAWQTSANVDCGCFGALAERSPGEAAVEDALMLVLLLVAWRWGRRLWSRAQWVRSIQLVMGGTVIALAVMGARFLPETARLAESDLRPGMELRGLELKGLDLDLSGGSYLVELFSPTCPRCKKAVPKLNRWAALENLPTVIGLNRYALDSKEMTEFRTQMKPRFDIATLSTSDWMRLTAGHGWPRLAWIRDGVVQRVWEHNGMPTTSQLQRALSTALDIRE